MTLPPRFIFVAGTLQLLVASANIFAFGKFRYLHHLRPLPIVVRQVFLVQNIYIMLVQAFFAMLCFFFASELTAGLPLGRTISGFLAVFWGSRVMLQLFYYDRELRRANRLFDLLFLAADGYLAAVFILAVVLPAVKEG